MAMIESELSLFEVHSKGVLRDPVELSQSMLGITPKRLSPVDVFRTSDEFIVTVTHPEMSINADVHKPIVAAPSIRMDHTVGVNFAANNGLQRSFGGIGNDLGVDASYPV